MAQDQPEKLFMRYIVKDVLPISTTDSPSLKAFIKSIAPQFKIPCRQTMKKMIIAEYNLVKQEVMSKISKSESTSLTFDEWTSVSGKSFLSITAHFISNGKLAKNLIGFINVTGRTDSSSLASTIDKSLTDWNLSTKVISITTDNAATCAAAIRKMEAKMSNGQKPIHIRCAAHSINLIVKSSLSEYEIELQDLRKTIHSIRSSPKKMQEIEEICKAKKIPFRKLKNDVPTRWNSTYYMIERYLKYFDQFKKIKNKYALHQIRNRRREAISSI